jgi:MFS family permease
MGLRKGTRVDISVAGPAGAAKLRWRDHLFININWFSLTLRTQVLAGLLVPLFVQNFVGEEQKGAYFGTMRLWALMVAVLAQAAFGLLSDRSRSRRGRRRPFIFAGTLLEILILLTLGWIASLQGVRGYAVLFAAYLFSMLFNNMSQAGTQGLLPDLVPEEKRGISSGIKMLLEIPLPLAVVGLVIAPMVSEGNINAAVLVTCVVMLVCMGLTLLARERPLQTNPGPLDWRPFASLLLMTAVFVAVILGLGEVVKWMVRSLEASRVAFGLIGVLAMFVAVVVGIFASLAVHLDKSIRRNRSFVWWIISRLAALVAINNIAVFLLYFIQEKLGLPANDAVNLAGLLPMVLGGFVIIFGLIAGWLSDRFDRRLLTAAGALIGAGGVALMVFAPAMGLLYVAAAVIGLSYALFNVASWALGADIIPKERAGEFLGLQNLAGAGAGAIGAYIGGAIADHSGYALLMGMFAVMFVLSAITTLFVRVRKG